MLGILFGNLLTATIWIAGIAIMIAATIATVRKLVKKEQPTEKDGKK